MSRNVKRTFFREGAMMPSYELENGEIRHCYANPMAGIKYFTDEQYEVYKKHCGIAQANLKRNKLKDGIASLWESVSKPFKRNK